MFKNHYQADGKPGNAFVKFNSTTGAVQKVFVGFEWAPDAPVEKDTDAIGLEREEYLYFLEFLT